MGYITNSNSCNDWISEKSAMAPFHRIKVSIWKDPLTSWSVAYKCPTKKQIDPQKIYHDQSPWYPKTYTAKS